MHMWMWFGYDLGEFLFPGLTVNTRWAFALTWITLFFVAVLFEGSKVYLAKVQREAQKKLYPYRSDERRNLLCDREQAGAMEPTTSRNASTGPVSRWAAMKMRTLVNAQQSLVFVAHNVVGYLLMLAVMVYNAHLLLAVVFGMMLGYFLFGTKLTRLQMQCFSTKRVVICTPECDDTAESTPPLLQSPASPEPLRCRTRACLPAAPYLPAAPPTPPACSYGARRCPSRVARARKMQASACRHPEPGVEDAQLLGAERPGCCKKQEPPPEEKCCKSSQETAAVVHEARPRRAEAAGRPGQASQASPGQQAQQAREDSPQITCCHNAKPTPTESQEQIIREL